MVAFRQPQQIGREVEFHTGEPFCAGHITFAQNRIGRGVAYQATIVPYLLPEGLKVLNGPLMEGVVIGKRTETLLLQPTLELAHLAVFQCVL